MFTDGDCIEEGLFGLLVLFSLVWSPYYLVIILFKQDTE